MHMPVHSPPPSHQINSNALGTIFWLTHLIRRPILLQHEPRLDATHVISNDPLTTLLILYLSNTEFRINPSKEGSRQRAHYMHVAYNIFMCNCHLLSLTMMCTPITKLSQCVYQLAIHCVWSDFGTRVRLCYLWANINYVYSSSVEAVYYICYLSSFAAYLHVHWLLTSWSTQNTLQTT